MEHANTLDTNGTFHIAPAQWRSIRARLRARYAQLTDADLVLPRNGEAELIRRLQARLDLSAAELRMLITDI